MVALGRDASHTRITRKEQGNGMNWYIIRVVLHGANEEQYAVLHNRMAAIDCSRTIRSDGGVEYHLPPAEYFTVTTLSIENIAALARKAADGTGHANSVFVIQTTRMQWYGLQPVEQWNLQSG